MNKATETTASESDKWECSNCKEQSSIGCDVVDPKHPRKICIQCMADCVQIMLDLGYFELDDNQRMSISGFIMSDRSRGF